MSSEKIRIELRYDAIKDKDIIDFIDRNGSTRAGFIKSLVLQYKNSIESNRTPFQDSQPYLDQEKSSPKKQEKTERKIPKLGQSFSSNDFK
jgi:hypothetical protein